MTCEKCGRAVQIGSFPFCPHESTRLTVVSDDVPGGFWAENGFDTPQKFYSKSAHRAALERQGLKIRAKWAGPQDQHLSRWDAVDLEAATALVSRRKFKDVVAPEDAVPVAIEKADAGPVRLEEIL